jgi:predicted RNase H-like HicB family nuclease
MQVAIELIADPEQGGFTARLPDIPAYGEGESVEEAIADLREAVRGYIETFGLEDAVARLSTPEVRQVEWDLSERSGNGPSPPAPWLFRGAGSQQPPLS